MIARPPLRRLAADLRGISAVEFAMLAPVLILLICGTIDLGYIYVAQSSLTGAVAAAARASSATQESSQADRNAAMQTAIARTMNRFLLVPGQHLAVVATAYRNFSETRPEDYTDTNGNGKYDGPSGSFVGEPYTDRNGNGVWDPALPIANSTVGAEGDVVTYTATFPVQHLFGFLNLGGPGARGVTLRAASVVRNEPVKTQ